MNEKERGRKVSQKRRNENGSRCQSDSITGFEDGRKPQVKEDRRPLEAEKGKQILPRVSRRNTALDVLILICET